MIIFIICNNQKVNTTDVFFLVHVLYFPLAVAMPGRLTALVFEKPGKKIFRM